MDPFDFTGRYVFVAGGTSGINLGIAEGFAKRGARLTVISRSPERVAGAEGPPVSRRERRDPRASVGITS